MSGEYWNKEQHRQQGIRRGHIIRSLTQMISEVVFTNRLPCSRFLLAERYSSFHRGRTLKQGLHMKWNNGLWSAANLANLKVLHTRDDILQTLTWSLKWSCSIHSILNLSCRNRLNVGAGIMKQADHASDLRCQTSDERTWDASADLFQTLLQKRINYRRWLAWVLAYEVHILLERTSRNRFCCAIVDLMRLFLHVP